MVTKISLFFIAYLVLAQECSASLRALQETVGEIDTTGTNATDYDPEACDMAYYDLMNNTEVTSAEVMLSQALMEACHMDTAMDEICQSNVTWTSSDIKMDVCNLDAFAMYKDACGAAGASFCSLDATADGDIGVLDGLFTYKLKMDMRCMAMCIPMECNPDMLEQGGMMEAVKEYLTNELGFDLSELAMNATVTCNDPSGAVTVDARALFYGRV